MVVPRPRRSPPATVAGTATPVAGRVSVGAAGARGAAAPATTPPTRIYIVRAGDTVFGVAAKFDLTSKELLRINRIRDADFIFEGQRLRVSSDTATLTAANGATEVDAASRRRNRGQNDRGCDRSSWSRAAGRGTPSPGAPLRPLRSPATRPRWLPAMRSGPTTRRAGRVPTAAAASAAAELAARTAEPVTAEGQGPEIGPGAGTPPPVADAIDFSVRDSSVRVIAEETLGHYADGSTSVPRACASSTV